jgi:hypothetical protein
MIGNDYSMPLVVEHLLNLCTVTSADSPTTFRMAAEANTVVFSTCYWSIPKSAFYS